MSTTPVVYNSNHDKNIHWKRKVHLVLPSDLMDHAKPYMGRGRRGERGTEGWREGRIEVQREGWREGEKEKGEGG